jgi:hypothetical protein
MPVKDGMMVFAINGNTGTVRWFGWSMESGGLKGR